MGRPLVKRSPTTSVRRARKIDLLAAFTLDYWRDGRWYVGQLREVPDVFSQGRTLEALRDNIREVWQLMLKERPLPVSPGRRNHE